MRWHNKRNNKDNMTYKEIVNNFRGLVFDHKILRDFGYGNISDIKAKSQDEQDTQQADYPYAFLNPTTHTRTERSVVYRFNLIVMEMAQEDTDSTLQAQSQCMQYIDDLLAGLKYGPIGTHQDVDVTGVSITPFKERFQDTVAGATASLVIEIANPLDSCLAPFNPEYEEIIWVYNSIDRVIDGDPGGTKTYTFDGTYTDPNDDWQITKFIVPESGIYKIVLDMPITLVEPTALEILPEQPVINQLTEGPDNTIPADVMQNWPTVFVNDTQVYNIHAEWVIDATLTPGGYTWEFIWSENLPGEQSAVIQKANSELKIYKAN